MCCLYVLLQYSARTLTWYGSFMCRITAKLVHGLGGTISVDSIFGEWSSFTVDLPMYDDPQDLSHPERESLDKGLFEIILVHPPPNIEGRGGATNLVADELPSKLQAYGVSCVTLSSMDRLEDVLILKEEGSNTTKRKKFVLLVHEDLYNEESCLSFSKKTKSVLLTYGPKFSVRHSREHFISTLQVLPSVLMKRITKHVVAIDDDSTTSSSSGPNPPDRSPVPGVDDRRMANPPKQLQNFRILVAEDNKINQK